MNDRTVLKVGIATFIMTIMIGALLIWKSGIFLKASGTRLYGSFTSVSGLLKGGEVRYRGYKVGQVANINPQPEEILVTFWVRPGVDIPKESNLRIVFDGLIGEKYLDIVPNTKSKISAEKDDVLSGYATSSLADFVDVGTRNLIETKAILESLRNTLTDPKVETALRNIFIKIENITNDLSHITSITRSGDFQSIVESMAKMAEDLSAMSTNLKGITKDIDDKEIVAKFDKTITNLSEFSNNFGGNDSFKMSSLAAVRYSFPEDRGIYDANLDFNYGKQFIRVGFGNRLGSNKLLHVQQGIKMTEQFQTRIGLIYDEPGLGFDYQWTDNIGFTAEAFNFADIEFDFETRYKLGKNFDLTLNLFKDPDSGVHNNYSVGVSYQP